MMTKNIWNQWNQPRPHIAPHPHKSCFIPLAVMDNRNYVRYMLSEEYAQKRSNEFNDDLEMIFKEVITNEVNKIYKKCQYLSLNEMNTRYRRNNTTYYMYFTYRITSPDNFVKLIMNHEKEFIKNNHAADINSLYEFLKNYYRDERNKADVKYMIEDFIHSYFYDHEPNESNGIELFKCGAKSLEDIVHETKKANSILG